ncbi:hypothetical protein LG293_16660 (plasmid) [Citricoccus nitrophenolicus]
MPLSNTQVRAWLDAFNPPLAISAAADLASVTRMTLTQQLMRSKVRESIIVDISRRLTIDPLAELSKFSEYSDLAPSSPVGAEALSFIDWPELFQAVGWTARDTRFGDRDLGPVTFPDGSRTWVDTLDAGTGALRSEAAKLLGVSTSSVTHSMNSGLKPHVAVAFARSAGTAVASSLVVSGLLTPHEAGWTLDARSRAVQESSVPDLLELVGVRSVSALRQERKMLSFEEELG